MKKLSKVSGFTLVELLVVMGIIGVLVTLVAGNFRNSQTRGRDVNRKSDLKQISEALELFYADYGKYPPESNGKINGCPFSPATGTGIECVWGTGEFTDSKTVYFKTMPKDPVNNFTYIYRIVPLSSGQKFQLFSKLENTKDPDLITTTYNCGSAAGLCNFSLPAATQIQVNSV